MNATLRKTMIAMAVAALFGASAAYASDGDHRGNSDPVSFEKKIELKSDVHLYGDPRVSGDINVDSAAISIVDNAQTNGNNAGENINLTNHASAGDNAARDSSGNIGANIAAGDNNQQDNAAALSAADASFTFGMADAEVFVNQQGAMNSTYNVGVTNAASIDNSAFRNAAGNIGVNVTSGNNNQQKNAMAASVATTSFAQATVSSHQVSANNAVSNTGYVQQYTDTVDVELSGPVQGYGIGLGIGGYEGSTSQSGYADQIGDVYPDTWSGDSHPGGSQTGHIDLDSAAQGAVDLNGDGGALAFGIDTSGSESGSLGFTELTYSDLYANLAGTVTTTRWVVVDATNTASLGGNAFRNASGNIGINISAGTGNQQANSLAMAVAQPSTGGGGGGGGGEQ